MASDIVFENAIKNGVKEIIKVLKTRERWWLLKYVFIPILCVWLGFFLNNRYNRDKLLTIPTTVIDGSTGNTIHIGNPLPHKGYYEFPITLNDGGVDMRIDQYAFARKHGIKFNGE